MSSACGAVSLSLPCLFSLIPDASCCLSKTLEQICGGIGWQASVTAPLLGDGGLRLRPSLNAPAAFLTALCSPAYATTTTIMHVGLVVESDTTRFGIDPIPDKPRVKK